MHKCAGVGLQQSLQAVIFLDQLGLLLVGIFNRFIESYAIRTILSWLSIYSRFTAFTYGVFDVGAIIYYFSISGVFLFLAVRVFEARKYN